jgi:hypothetical protein
MAHNDPLCSHHDDVRDCMICHRREGQCSFGSCQKAATHKVVQSRFLVWKRNPNRRRKMANTAKRYDEHGQRVTDCCGSYSTYMEVNSRGDQALCCKACYHEVTVGQGDGNEFAPGVTADEYYKAAFAAEAV